MMMLESRDFIAKYVFAGVFRWRFYVKFKIIKLEMVCE